MKIQIPGRKALVFFSLFCLAAAGPRRVHAGKFGTWFPANELYFTAPVAQNVHYAGQAKNTGANAWGLGYRTVGLGDGIGRTAALQLQRLTVTNKARGVNGTINLLELLAGAEYLSPLQDGRQLRYGAAALANLGISDTTLYAAPMLTVSLLFQDDIRAETPNGFNLTFYYRLTDVELNNAAGQPGTLRPALGFRLGYIFPGFWGNK